jgi:hypothetical protein
MYQQRIDIIANLQILFLKPVENIEVSLVICTFNKTMYVQQHPV